MRLILGESLQRIREKIACPQLGDIHYGEWGFLSPDKRLAISEMIETIKFLDKMVEDMLQSKPKEGEWKEDFDGDYYCPFCAHYPKEIINFCPNCGARMKGIECE
jgi:rubrerythrin